MPAYTAPVAEMRFVIGAVTGFDRVRALPRFADVSDDLLAAVLTEAGRFGSEVLAPLNPVGDRLGAELHDGTVTTPAGFIDAYRQFVEGGWPTLKFAAAEGGQGLPRVLSTAVAEIWTAANMAFALCPMLTEAVAEALARYGSPALKAAYLPKLITGEWAGTMNLTEPQAGTDLALVRTRAVADGAHYRITGQKIFITYGEHDLTPNIVHMVLARTADAPPGVKGLSLFLVPKFLVDGDGRLGERNDVRCVSIEHKLGIRASPTAMMAYGDQGGAIGYLIGEENRGLDLMFTMMNAARLAVGLEGVGIADRAYQRARAYAFARLQGRDIAGKRRGAVPIALHPDVQRMLLAMKANSEAARALAYFVASETDVAEEHADAEQRRASLRRVDLLTPVVKAWCTDVGIAAANIGIQVHGGMGYIEESGAPQHLRDARIAAIYEGTNGIQAQDLVHRKVARDGGAAMGELIAGMRAFDEIMSGVNEPAAVAIRERLRRAVDDLAESTQWLTRHADEPQRISAGAVHYLELCGIAVGGWLMARAALMALRQLAEGTGDTAFLHGKLASVRFFAETAMVTTSALKAQFVGCGEALAGLDTDRDL
ncbi:MAG: acyl-CoA dehydrogenase [Rhodospirillales bacterium]|nr:acyl-CoA dehydrogenase [Rhodospirillales bacterium]